MRAASVSFTATSSWEQVRQESLASMAEARLQRAELVDNTSRTTPRTED